MRTVQEREENILRRYKVTPITPVPLLSATICMGVILYLPTLAIMLVLAHTLWVNPGHARARGEMEALSACDDRDAWWSPDEAPGEDSGGERAA